MNWNSKYTYIGIVFLVGTVVFFQSACKQPDQFLPGKIVICNAEMRNNGKDLYLSKDDSTVFFANGITQSSLEAHSGKYSALTIPKTQAFAMGYKINSVDPDWYFNVSVWRKSKNGKGALVVAADNTELLYEATTFAVDSTPDGWVKLQLDVLTSPLFSNQDLIFYVWNNGTDSVYFDDLVVKRLKRPDYPNYREQPLVIEMDTFAYLKIYNKRREAISEGVLQSSDNDWVKGFVYGDSKMMKVKLRLKGDWLDHLWGDKWSYRIKVGKGNAWNRLRTFSVQTPEARDFMMEWMAHKLYGSKDVLTTRYGFVPLIVNNQSKGLYAWEEHFEKQIVESNNRREGPIVKFSEEAMWQIQKILIRKKVWKTLPFFEAAEIEPFGEGKVQDSPVLFSQFITAQKLMYQYRAHLMPASQIFDIDKLAAYFAMLDLTHARHGMVWHNQRFYYNPVLSKLEPIAFDGYTDLPATDVSISDNQANVVMNSTYLNEEEYLYFDFFRDSVFVGKYLDKLAEFSNKKSIDSILFSLSNEERHYDSLLKLEFVHYRYDTSFFRRSAEGIRNYLPELTVKLNLYLDTIQGIPEIKKQHYTDTSTFENTPEFFVNAYMESHEGDSMVIGIHNYYPQEIILVGASIKDKFIFNYFYSKPSIEAYTQGLDGVVRNLTVDSVSNFVFFTLKDHEDIFKIPIHRWPYPSGITPQQELFQQIDLANNPFIERIVNHNIYIKKDSLVINKPFLIPEGYTVHFEPGTVMNLVENAMFISYSPVIMRGTPDAPIVITSSDFTGNGFTVLQAEGRSQVEHTRFENLNTLNYKGWELTGAVTFYESDVEIKHSVVYRNQCEDGLNIIRSKFLTEDVTFDYTWGDAFDSDFSNGLVLNCKFTNLGNDAIDFSGSTITIQDVTIDKAADKGISGGEMSHLTVKNTNIRRCNIGIASKDLSIVEVTGTKVLDCNYGLVLLQKKPEYGPGTLFFNQSIIQNPQTPMLIEVGSKVFQDGNEIQGTVKNAGDLFY